MSTQRQYGHSTLAEMFVRNAKDSLLEHPHTDVGQTINIPPLRSQIVAFRTTNGGASHIRYEIIKPNGEFTSDMTFREAAMLVDELLDGNTTRSNTTNTSEEIAAHRLTISESVMLGLNDRTPEAASAGRIDNTKYVSLVDDEHGEHGGRERHARGERPMLEHMRRQSDRHPGGRIKRGR